MANLSNKYIEARRELSKARIALELLLLKADCAEPITQSELEKAQETLIKAEKTHYEQWLKCIH